MQPPLQCALAHAQVSGDLFDADIAIAQIGFDESPNAGGQVGSRQALAALHLKPRQQRLVQAGIGSRQGGVEHLRGPGNGVDGLIEAQRALEHVPVQADVGRLRMGKAHPQRSEPFAGALSQHGVERTD
ncbi:hypothetical protein D3C81_1158240 [compost metagenome]